LVVSYSVINRVNIQKPIKYDPLKLNSVLFHCSMGQSRHKNFVRRAHNHLS